MQSDRPTHPPRLHHSPPPPLRSVRLLDQLRKRIRYRHYSLSTESSYAHWVRAFIRFHGLRHPREMGVREVEAFLSHLPNQREASASIYTHVLNRGAGGVASPLDSLHCAEPACIYLH